jgi:iron complex outermembrane receptor protein
VLGAMLCVMLGAMPCAIFCALLGGAAGRAEADPLDLRPVEVRDRRIEPGSAQAEDTAFATTVDAPQAAAEGGQVAEHLARTVGVQVRRTGTHGDFAAVLIRGSSASQVGVFLDGIPLSLGRGGLLDLSLFPLLSLARIEVFRGYVPAEFGSEGIGGAINLVPGRAPKKPRTRLTLGVGSFGLWQLGVSRAARHGAVRYAVNLALQGAKNDFRFFSDNDTPYQLADDRWLTRENNRSFVASGLGWLQWRPSRTLRITLLESLQVKDKGVPGGGAVQALSANRKRVHQVFDLKVEKRNLGHPSVSAMARANAQVTWERFVDPEGEFPSGTQDQQDLSVGAGVLGRLSWAPHAPQILSLIPEYRFENYQGQDPGRALPTSRRHRLGLALRDRVVLWRDRLSLTPVVRADLLWHEVHGQDAAGGSLSDAFHWFVSPRFGVRVRPLKWLELRGNVGRYFRPPSIFELYGDRGTTVGNPQLVPETGLSGDVGVVISLVEPGRSASRESPPRGAGARSPRGAGARSPRGAGARPAAGGPSAADQRASRWRWLERVRLEAAFFGRDARDLIQWIRNSPHTSTALNISRATTVGAELGLGLWLRLHRQLRARLTANYTLLHTRNRSGQPALEGNRLPGRPLHELNGRVDLVWRLGRWGAGVHWNVRHVSESYLDEANLFLPVPQRTLHEVGLVVKPWIPGFSLTATFRNVGDLRVEHQDAPAYTGLGRIPRPLMDYAGFPLPGWHFYLTAVWRR